MKETIGLLGGGSQADEVEYYLSDNFEVTFKAVSAEYVNSSDPKLVDISESEQYKEAKVISAIGAPAIKKKLVEMWPGEEYVTLISSEATVSDDCIVGVGTVVAPGAVITTKVEIGDHVLINIGATISHDCRIGDYATISPGANIGGKVEIGEGVFVGIGAVISNNIRIAPGSIIGAGSVVINNIDDENSVVVGVPGKIIKTNTSWLSEV